MVKLRKLRKSTTSEQLVFEGETATLSCNYSGSVGSDTLLWYQQHCRSIPQYLLLVNEGQSVRQCDDVSD